MHELQNDYSDLLREFKEGKRIDKLTQFLQMQQEYRAAMKEIGTKLENLDDEFHVHYRHNPIHHMERRLKEPSSIAKKLDKNHLPLTIEAIKENLFDIAGVRVICNYVDDVYNVEKLLLNQSDIQLLNRKDYIANPKLNGYRSLHLIVTVPVFLSEKTIDVPVEVQIRTIAMDLWATLEHELSYKNENDDKVADYVCLLKECSDKLSDIDVTMQEIHKDISVMSEK